MEHITEPARPLPVITTVDVCVLGGSCTGVFAAIRAARMGCRVALVERLNCFGGTATAGMVNIWHSIHDTRFETQIIAGLTTETVERLERRQACIRRERNANAGFILNTEELKIELDEMVREHDIVPFLHTMAVAPIRVGERLSHVVIENKDGRQAIAARIFIDATGDGDLAAACAIPFIIEAHPQPPTTCARISGLQGLHIPTLWNRHRDEFAVPEDSGWNCEIPGSDTVRMHADTHVFGVDLSRADHLTFAEMEGRRLTRALMDMVRRHEPDRAQALCLMACASLIGIRETRRFSAVHRLTEAEVLHGLRCDDAIANGSYRVDVHHPRGGGYLFRYLDGAEVSITAAGRVHGRWRAEIAEDPTFYQIPYRCLLHEAVPNLIMSGRMIAADQPAFGAIRVMVNTNQTGEAAGVAAALACAGDCDPLAIDPQVLRHSLAQGGSIML